MSKEVRLETAAQQFVEDTADRHIYINWNRRKDELKWIGHKRATSINRIQMFRIFRSMVDQAVKFLFAYYVQNMSKASCQSFYTSMARDGYLAMHIHMIDLFESLQRAVKLR